MTGHSPILFRLTPKEPRTTGTLTIFPPGPSLYNAFSLERLLRNDAVARGHQSHFVHLDERLAIQAQTVDQGLKMPGKHMGLDQS